MTQPNLFIVGSMKCGTTILYDFLIEHPQIAGARGKEVHFFSLKHEKGLDWYLDHFDLDAEVNYQLDASPTYFDMANDDLLPNRIHKFSPDARIIIMIREPIERAVSQFMHYKHINKVDEIQGMTFSQFMRDRWPEHLSRKVLEDLYRHITEFSYYHDKIARYAKVFGRDRVMVIHNDDLRHHGGTVMASVYNFLDLDFPSEGDFNRQKYVRPAKRQDEDEVLLYTMAEQYSRDYWLSCRTPIVTRPTPPETSEDNSVLLNMPVGGRYKEVSVGRDGYLFLTEGTNSPIAMFHDPAAKTNALIQQWHQVIQDRKERLAGNGIEFYQCMVPEKLSILGEKLNWNLDPTKSYAHQLYAHAPQKIRDNIIYLNEFFENSELRDEFYLKTDSHWSHIGAFGAYQAICYRLGVTAREDLLRRPFSTGSVQFDLGSKLPTPIREDARFCNFRQEAKVVEEGSMVKFKRKHVRENDGGLHVGSIMRFHNTSAPDPRRVLLFGDSFSEYRDHLLTGLMSETFAELIFAWSTSLDHKLIAKYKPDLVCCVMTERFMSRLPDDNTDIAAYVDSILNKEAANV